VAPPRQRLGTDPRDPDSTTVGALIATHQSGPLRLSEGTVRDFLIGIRYVGRGGAIVRAGGRVVKNVAGYDLMKVMTGSFGTLGIVVEATFKVRPAPEHTAMALGAFARAGDALDAAEEIADVVALAHLEVLSPGVAAAALGRGGKFLLAAGFAGNRAELDRQRAQIAEVLDGRPEFLEDGDADAAYIRLRDATLPPAALAARIAVLPAELQRCLDACGAGDFLAHAGSGVAEIASVGSLNPRSAELLLTQWREIARSARGNLRVIRAAPELRGTIEFFDAPDRAALALMRRLKSAFDPAGVFNPGCFVGGL
jgi:glycolate dehydrogenase FAD-binding subunit